MFNFFTWIYHESWSLKKKFIKRDGQILTPLESVFMQIQSISNFPAQEVSIAVT